MSGRLALVLAAAAVLVLAAVFALAPRREGFASPATRALCAAAGRAFAEGDSSLAGFRARAGAADADAAIHADARRLWKEGRLTPDALEEALA